MAAGVSRTRRERAGDHRALLPLRAQARRAEPGLVVLDVHLVGVPPMTDFHQPQPVQKCAGCGADCDWCVCFGVATVLCDGDGGGI